MEKLLNLTEDEIIYIELALESLIQTLNNAFQDEEGIIHPSEKYKQLLKKITNN